VENLRQTCDLCYDNLRTNLKIFCKSGPCISGGWPYSPVCRHLPPVDCPWSQFRAKLLGRMPPISEGSCHVIFAFSYHSHYISAAVFDSMCLTEPICPNLVAISAGSHKNYLLWKNFSYVQPTASKHWRTKVKLSNYTEDNSAALHTKDARLWHPFCCHSALQSFLHSTTSFSV